MSEQEREQFYWRISLILMLISPWILYSLSKTAPNPFVGLFLFKFIIMIGAISNIVILLTLEMLYAGIAKGKTSFKVWVNNPSVDFKHRVQGSIKGCTHTIEQKLKGLNFETEVTQLAQTEYEEQWIQFRKAAQKPVHHFLNHAFSGKIKLVPEINGVEIYIHLKLEDTLILETGETSKLQAISEFIVLKTPELQMKGVPFTLYSGLIFAYATLITGIAMSLGVQFNQGIFNSLAMSGIGTILLSLFFSFKNGKDFMGWRLVFSGLYLAALPYFAWMLSIVI